MRKVPHFEGPPYSFSNETCLHFWVYGELPWLPSLQLFAPGLHGLRLQYQQEDSGVRESEGRQSLIRSAR